MDAPEMATGKLKTFTKPRRYRVAWRFDRDDNQKRYRERKRHRGNRIGPGSHGLRQQIMPRSQSEDWCGADGRAACSVRDTSKDFQHSSTAALYHGFRSNA